MSSSHHPMNQDAPTPDDQWDNQEESHDYVDSWGNEEENNETHDSLLITAAIDGDADVCQQLINDCQIVDFIDSNGKTALDYALEKKHHAVIMLLIKHDALTHAPAATLQSAYKFLATSSLEDPDTWMILDGLSLRAKKPSSGFKPLQIERLNKYAKLLNEEKKLAYRAIVVAGNDIFTPTDLLNIIASYDNPLEPPRAKKFDQKDLDERLSKFETKTPMPSKDEEKTPSIHERKEYKASGPTIELGHHLAKKLQEDADLELAQTIANKEKNSFRVTDDENRYKHAFYRENSNAIDSKNELRTYKEGMNELDRGGILNDKNRDHLVAMLDAKNNPAQVVHLLTMLNDQRLLTSSNFDQLYQHRAYLESHIIPAMSYFRLKRQFNANTFAQLLHDLPDFSREAVLGETPYNLFNHFSRTTQWYDNILEKVASHKDEKKHSRLRLTK